MVGVVSGYFTKGQNINFGVSPTAIHLLLFNMRQREIQRLKSLAPGEEDNDEDLQEIEIMFPKTEVPISSPWVHPYTSVSEVCNITEEEEEEDDDDSGGSHDAASYSGDKKGKELDYHRNIDNNHLLSATPSQVDFHDFFQLCTPQNYHFCLFLILYSLENTSTTTHYPTRAILR